MLLSPGAAVHTAGQLSEAAPAGRQHPSAHPYHRGAAGGEAENRSD